MLSAGSTDIQQLTFVADDFSFGVFQFIMMSGQTHIGTVPAGSDVMLLR